MPKELKIIQDFYDFMLWMIKHTEKFPRHHRYSLGVSIETRLQKILELFLKAKYRKEKSKVLNDVNIELEILRFQLRLAKDLKVLTVKSYGFGSKGLLEMISRYKSKGQAFLYRMNSAVLVEWREMKLSGD